MSREYTHNRKASGGNAKADASTGVPEKNNLEYVQKRKAKAKRENTLIAVLILFIIIVATSIIAATTISIIQMIDGITGKSIPNSGSYS